MMSETITRIMEAARANLCLFVSGFPVGGGRGGEYVRGIDDVELSVRRWTAFRWRRRLSGCDNIVDPQDHGSDLYC